MKTTEFYVSLVFPEGAKMVTPSIYTKPITCEEPVEVFPHQMGGNCILIKNCHFFMFPSHNKEIMEYKENDARTEYIVEDENKKYNVMAYLNSERGPQENPIGLVTELPKGLVMKLIEPTNAFVFSGLSLMLFDVNHNFE